MAIITYEHQFRVAYKETDQMGVMHHSNYIVLYEKARTEWLEETGGVYECPIPKDVKPRLNE